MGSASVIGGGSHPHEPPAAHQQRPENALDALLDELQTFSRPSSQQGHTTQQQQQQQQQQQGSTTMLSELGRSGSIRGEAAGASTALSTTTVRPPCISDIGRKGSVDSSSGPLLPNVVGTLVVTPAVTGAGPPNAGGTLRRLHSYPSSSDTDTSPPIARLQVSLQEQPSLPTLPQGFVPGQKPPVPERNAELLQLASARRVPPPPPPRTSSRSPLASPTSPQLPPRNHSYNLQSGNATLRRVPPARGTLPVKEGKPPMALPTEQQPSAPVSALEAVAVAVAVAAATPSPVLHNKSINSQSSAVLSTSNSSSCESVNSQEGLQSKKGRQEQLEQRHQELLRKQKALQEQYARLQQLQRNTAGLTTIPPAPPDLLKKTGSESNLLAKMGLGLSTASSGSLTSLTVKPSVVQEVSVDGLRARQDESNDQQQQQQQQQTMTVNVSASSVGTGTSITSSSNESNSSQAAIASATISTAVVATATATATAMSNAASTTSTTTTSKIYETDIL